MHTVHPSIVAQRQSAHNLNLAGLASTPLSLTSMPSQGPEVLTVRYSEIGKDW